MSATRVHGRLRGYSLVVVMMTLGLITVSILSLWAYVETSSKTMGEALRSRRAFYVCDGMTRMTSLLLGQYARETDTPTPAGAKFFVEDMNRGGADLVNITPDGYVVKQFQIDDIQLTGEAARIPNGPFSGLVGRESLMRFRIRVARAGEGAEICQIDKALALTEIGLFQFSVYGALKDDLVLSYDAAGKTMVIDGRVHSNGNLCFATRGAGTNLFLESASAAGSILINDVARKCSYVREASGGSVYLKKSGGAPFPAAGAPLLAEVAALTAAGDGDEPGWTGSQPTWGEYARDSAQGVRALSVPGSPWRPGVRGADTNAYSQNGELAYLILPPAPDEPASDARTHLAVQADIRIIDGVWYKKRRANPNYWPGDPIWSDHPGNAIDRFASQHTLTADPDGDGVDETVAVSAWARLAATTTRSDGLRINVGQGDLFFGGTVPRRYSWYEHDPTTGRLSDGDAPGLAKGVISYGSLVRDGGGWKPGVVSGCSGACNAATDLELCDDPATLPNMTPTESRGFDIGSAALCGDGTSQLLLAAGSRMFIPSPYWSGRDDSGPAGGCPPPDPDDPSEICPCPCNAVTCGDGDDAGVAHTHRRFFHPINFDIEEFQDALMSSASGELGTHFFGDFNGIVWISTLHAFNWGNPRPVEEPDPWAPKLARHSSRFGVPFPLCSETRFPAPGIAGQVADPASPRAVYPDCASASWQLPATATDDLDEGRGFNNAVRVFNGADIDPDVLPKGLTIVTDMPMIVMGDMNAGSRPATVSEGYAGDGSRWVPMLLGGSHMVFLSNAWDDGPNHHPPSAQSSFDSGSRNASNTKYHAAFLTGFPLYAETFSDWTPAPKDLNSAFWMFEDWSGRDFTINGSVVFALQSTYSSRATHTTFDPTPAAGGDPDTFAIRFDYRLSHLKNQPPGAVAFTVESVRNWQRR